MSKTCRRNHPSMTAVLAGMLVLAGPIAALAAPFCVRTESIPPQCLYFDAGECGKRATQMGGTCVVNPAEVHVSNSLGHYCLLTSSGVTSCIYTDPGVCAAEAQHQHGACTLAPERPESPGADPYRDVRPSMAGG
jgi:hypothetical protein